jgi:protein SMG6
MDLFVRLHGMLFTKIDLDNFPDVMARFMERLEEDARLDGVSRKATVTQVDWILMASVNIAAILQYGIQAGVVRKALSIEGQERRRAQAAAEEDDEDEENGEHHHEEEVNGHDVVPEITPTYTHALHLAFSVLQFTFDHPTRQQGLNVVLNPYITLFLTFLSTLFRQSHVANIMIDHVPWSGLAGFLNKARLDIREETRLTCGPPLPEDWAARGMEWVGRRVYERGFWKTKTLSRGSGSMAQPTPRSSGERFQSEMDVLLANFETTVDISEGVVDEAEGADVTDGPIAVNQRRWKRVTWASGVIVKHVDGFALNENGVVIEGGLKRRLEENEQVRREEEEKEQARLQARRERERLEELEELEAMGSGDEMDSSKAGLACSSSQYSLTFQDRRGHLRNALDPTRKSKRAVKTALRAVPGYTMLVFDTNVMLSSLDIFKRTVEGGQWSVIVPLPVVTELDGLSKNPTPLGLAAIQAISYLESRIRTHSLCLKIQTSRGNYLSDLLIRTEHVDFSDPAVASRNMDDLILNIAAFQSEHFTDRSAILGQPEAEIGATKVVLVTWDRNLRLRARARGIEAVDEKEVKGVLGG